MAVCASIVIWSEQEVVHDFTGRCSGCHLNDPEKDGKLIFTKDIDNLCSQCHDEGRGLSHPVGVKPSFRLPPEFPLDWKGELTCDTCHVAHASDSKSERFLLRTRLVGELFCRSCHEVSIEGIALHRTGIETAHIGSHYTNRMRIYDTIDELSMKCLNCHDASLGDDTGIQVAGSESYSHKRSIGVSHPIGSDYYMVSYRHQGAYVKPEDLDKRIKLFNGKVGCGSCHNPYSKEHFQLVMSNEGSKLCFACHNK